MKRVSTRCLLYGVLVLFGFTSSGIWATDIESFEFNDPNGTALMNAVNTANPGNQWSTPNGGNDMLPSSVESGAYRVIKDFNALAQNHLDIANITSGTVYLTATMSGWKFTGPDIPDNPEQARFAFLNTDGVVGTEITAQMQIRRNTTTGGIELRGDAVGTAGSTDIVTLAPLATEQTDPFTMVLAVDLDSNSYEVFYKDGTNPTQVLGLGGIPERDANSIRFAVNNNFGSTNLFPTVIDEQFNVDRIALSDINPLTDLISLDVDRDTGSVTLINTSGAAINNIESYSITSAAGALDSSQWKTVTGNYDSGGDGSFDINDPWMIDSSTTSELSESMQAGGVDGGTLTIGQSLELDISSVMAPGVWIRNPLEDLHMVLNLAGGEARTVDVNFVGNGGARWQIGDLDFDTDLDVDDWTIFVAGAETDLSALSVAQAYHSGDLDGDGVNSVIDFGLFKDTFNAANGTGSFAAMLANIPEPSSSALVSWAALGLLWRRRSGALGMKFR